MNQQSYSFFGQNWRIVVSVFIISCFSTNSWAQSNNSITNRVDSDSIVMHITLYFSTNNGDWIEKSEYRKVTKILQWASADTLPQISLQGWADNNGSKEHNKQLSLRRAIAVRNYLILKGVSANRIAFEGCGVDTIASIDKKARRVDLFGIIKTKVVDTAQHEVVQAPQISPVKEEKQEVAKQEVAKEVEPKQIETTVVAETPKSDPQPIQAETPIEKTKKEPSRWYGGVGGGVSFGRGTFCSFAMDETRPGFNVGVLGGYKINKLLSAELSLDYTRMVLGSYDCCQLLWLASDGNRYAAPVAGMSNYQYNDLRSTTNLFGLGAHLNIELVSIWSDKSRWSALVSPAIYGVCSSANIKQLSTGKSAMDANSFHFGVGADLGVGYQITPCMGLRLATGVNYLIGKGIDGLPKEEHKTSYVWNSSVKLIFKL